MASEIYETPIENLDLSVRVFNSLKRTGITTVGEVLDMLDKGPEAMLSIRNFGEKSLDELRERLRGEGLSGGSRRSRRRAGRRSRAGMRHQVAGITLGRSSGHRTALRRNLVTEFFRHEKIRTTRAKAAAIRGEAERLITVAKHGNAAGEAEGRARPPPGGRQAE